jgi:hypothetical protein
MTTHALLLEYLSAYNNHDINKIVSFLHPDCRVIFNGQLVLQGIDTMRPTYEQDFLNPQASATLLEYNEDTNDQNRIRALLKIHDNRLLDVTYVFETKENEGKHNNKKMIEHIIHSIKSEQDLQ